jgi:hypothetical protein
VRGGERETGIERAAHEVSAPGSRILMRSLRARRVAPAFPSTPSTSCALLPLAPPPRSNGTLRGAVERVGGAGAERTTARPMRRNSKIPFPFGRGEWRWVVCARRIEFAERYKRALPHSGHSASAASPAVE